MIRQLGIACALVALVHVDARAQTAPIDAQLFHPTATARGFFTVDGAFVLRHLGGSASLYATYALNPLAARCVGRFTDSVTGAIRGCEPAGATAPGGRLIGHQLAMEASASFALVDHLEIAIALPFVAYQTMDNTLSGVAVGATHASAIGDFRLDVKALLHAFQLRSKQRIGLAIIVGGSAPSGDTSAYLSQGWTGRLRLVFEWHAPAGGIAFNFGALLRATQSFGDLYVGNQLSYGLAARVRLIEGLELLAEASGLVGVGLPAQAGGISQTEAPAEALGGLRYRAPFGFELSIAGGAGFTQGYGAPDARAVLGFRYASPDRKGVAPVAVPVELDADGDGTPDERDRCPGLFGPKDNYGCPQADRDRDGVPDSQDRCIDEVGVRALNGCPEIDSDGDGLVDRLDKCPVEAGLADLEGCPLPDKDADGVPDSTDRCPAEAGTRENQGCPDFDSDGDGYVDRLDQCPVEEEVWNGIDDDDGCPDVGKPLARLLSDRIELLTPITFVGNSTTISEKSHSVLGVVAAFINLHREIVRVRIEGHMATLSGAFDNLETSRERAIAVRRYLQDTLGVDPKRLTAQGFGRDRPTVAGNSAKAKQTNSRIELIRDAGGKE